MLRNSAQTRNDPAIQPSMTTPMPTAADLLAGRKRILVTGGAGFIGGRLWFDAF